MRINLQTVCNKQTITRDDGKKINDMIQRAWNKEDKIIINFNHILIASVSFIDEAFGRLAFDYDKEVLRNKLLFSNMEEFDRALLRDIFLSRYHQKELGQNGPSRRQKRNIPK